MISRPAAGDPHHYDPQDLCAGGKRRVAQRAAELVPENGTIPLDSGTTVYELSRQLAQRRGLHVATNDLICALSSNPEISVFMLGGALRTANFSMNGPFTENVIRQLHADAVDFSRGLMDFSMDELPTKRLMIRSAWQIVLLCCHTKLESSVFVSICPLSDIDVIITEAETDPGILAKLEEQGIKVFTA